MYMQIMFKDGWETHSDLGYNALYAHVYALFFKINYYYLYKIAIK